MAEVRDGQWCPSAWEYSLRLACDGASDAELTELVACRDAFNSGFMLARAKRSKLNIGAMDLLVYQNGGSSGVILPSSEGVACCSRMLLILPSTVLCVYA